ncbi:MAG TPA: chemotaxis-specific protein-glutamate methyltransferase CheB [Ilumatobacteraceae bacterium]
MTLPTRLGPVRVVVVEDSAVQRAHLVGVLEADGDIEVIGEAATAIAAITLVAELRPDVVTLDLQIPGGGGLHALEQIMGHTPTPVLVLSATVQSDRSALAVEALVAGAVLALPKPAVWTRLLEAELRGHVRTLRHVHVIRHIRGRLQQRPPLAVRTPSAPSAGQSAVVAIAASTGGPPALAKVLRGLGGLAAPVLVVQHIHTEFVPGLVSWMARISALPVVTARDGEPLREGCVYIAPGGRHLRVGATMQIELSERPHTVHCPSADQLFESVANEAGRRGIGVVLTGMGDDGAAGLAAMHRRGAQTIAQDEATSAVYGMPRAAHRLGVVDHQLPLDEIAEAILRAAQRRLALK